ncbi:hypothetical protein MTR_1g012335 [Medicago truncatula]|uniref:Uncharacterized protein n=1 Tax=Medicago truncatula TaxID=3880 RepID=A0A072VNW5_MEDTR|nr:hypothetical protein MTR_1g012335 [Medicago truncatula]
MAVSRKFLYTKGDPLTNIVYNTLNTLKGKATENTADFQCGSFWYIAPEGQLSGGDSSEQSSDKSSVPPPKLNVQSDMIGSMRVTTFTNISQKSKSESNSQLMKSRKHHKEYTSVLREKSFHMKEPKACGKDQNYCAGIPFDEASGKYVPQDEKDEQKRMLRRGSLKWRMPWKIIKSNLRVPLLPGKEVLEKELVSAKSLAKNSMASYQQALDIEHMTIQQVESCGKRSWICFKMNLRKRSKS